MTRSRTTLRFRLALAALVIAGVGVRVWFVVAEAQPLPDPGDAIAYHLLGQGIAEGDGYVRPFDRIAGRSIPTAEWAPAFPAVLALADVAGLDTVDDQRVAAACLAALGIVLTGLAGRRHAGPAAGVVAAAVIAFHPLLIQHDTSLLTEVLALAGGAAVLLVSLPFGGAGGSVRAGRAVMSWPTAVLAGGLVGAAALIRADALALVPFLLVPLFLVGAGGRAMSRRRGLALAGVAIASAAVVVAPWVVRNTVRLGSFVGVSTNASTAIAGANCDVTYTGDVVGYWRFGPGCFTGYDTADLVRRGEAPVARDALDQGLTYAREHAGRAPAVVGTRVLRLWGLWDVDEQASLAALDERKSASWVRAGTYVGWAVAALAVMALIDLIRRRSWTSLVALGAPLLAVTAAAAVTYGNARFRASAEPALAVLAATVVTAPWRRR